MGLSKINVDNFEPICPSSNPKSFIDYFWTDPMRLSRNNLYGFCLALKPNPLLTSPASGEEYSPP